MTYRRYFFFSFILLFLSLGVYLALPFPEEGLTRPRAQSLVITDRNGALLREVLSLESTSSVPIKLSDVPKSMILATLAAEDKNFYSHIGVDFSATMRALWQNLSAFKIISGASTISQQTARLMLSLERGVLSKIQTILFAFRLEAHFSKDEILTAYFNRAPFGNQCYGLGAAARFYFQKSPSQLTLAESALLAGLPQSPTIYNPFSHLENARKRQREVLRRMLTNGFISEKEHRDALLQEIDFATVKNTFLAPHFVDYVLKIFSDSLQLQTLITSLDLDLQLQCEILARGHLARLKKNRVTNTALVVMENQTGEILAMVGSADYFNAEIDGQYNVAIGSRQPGSSLKPFTYALGLEHGLTPSTILPDLPLPFEVEGRYDESNPTGVEHFFPQNFDRKFHGAVRLREALACSYNITAVKALQSIGVENLYNRLKMMDFTTLHREPQFYGLGLTLGNSDVRLIEMVRAYRAFARQGKMVCLTPLVATVTLSGDTLLMNKPQSIEVFSPQAAYLIADILSDNAARRASFGANSVLRFPFATLCKTGTTKDYRDNWTFGATEDFTVGVWAGNSDNSPMRDVSGVDGAGGLMHDVLMLLSKKFPHKRGFSKTEFEEPQGIRRLRICPLSGERAGANCGATIEEKYIIGKEPARLCAFHKRYKIDSRNGLLATAQTPNRFVRETVFVDYPPLFRDWAMSQKIPLPPHLVSNLDKDTVAAGSVPTQLAEPEILFPKSGMIFALDGALRPEFQRISFSANLPLSNESVKWRLNGEIVGKSRSHEKFSWQIAPGNYLLEAVVENKPSRAVQFSVIK